MDASIKTAGTPKASGKQSVCPKQWTSALKIGLIIVEISDPALTAKKNMEKYVAMSAACSGILNWSPPKAPTHGRMPPLPIAMRAKPMNMLISGEKFKVDIELIERSVLPNE